MINQSYLNNCSPVCNGVLTAKPGCTTGAATVLAAGNKIVFAVFNT